MFWYLFVSSSNPVPSSYSRSQGHQRVSELPPAAGESTYAWVTFYLADRRNNSLTSVVCMESSMTTMYLDIT